MKHLSDYSVENGTGPLYYTPEPLSHLSGNSVILTMAIHYRRKNKWKQVTFEGLVEVMKPINMKVSIPPAEVNLLRSLPTSTIRKMMTPTATNPYNALKR